MDFQKMQQNAKQSSPEAKQKVIDTFTMDLAKKLYTDMLKDGLLTAKTEKKTAAEDSIENALIFMEAAEMKRKELRNV